MNDDKKPDEQPAPLEVSGDPLTQRPAAPSLNRKQRRTLQAINRSKDKKEKLYQRGHP
jgi:hypothetical protein